MYEYYWVYTIAQIELMNIDIPFTCYKDKKDKNDTPTREEMDAVVEKWKERKKRRKWNMQDLLAKKNNDTDISGKDTLTEHKNDG